MKRALVGVVALALSGCMPGGADLPPVDTPWPYDAVAFAEQVTGLERGTTFPLSSGMTPRLERVDVQWIPLPQLIDVSIVLDAPRRPSDTSLDELTDFGEFCLRYGTAVVRRVVPAEEWIRVRVFTILYRRDQTAAPVRATDLGFGFRVVGGQCTLAPPYPAALAANAEQRARMPL